MRYTIVNDTIRPLDNNWPRTNKEAIKESIRKWKFILDSLLLAYDENVELKNYSDSCALCQLHMEKKGTCEKCPVFNKTKVRGCKNTPYIKFTKSEDLSNRIKYCRKEIEFLEGLLE